MLKQALAQNGLIAILRGVRPDEVQAIGQVLYQAGFRVIEVPLNSPDPYTSIRTLRDSLPADCLIGAGTVLTPEQVEQVKAAGGQVVVMPHSDAKVLRAAKAVGLYLSPGVATPTEAFAALAEGADVLKLFPAEQMGPAVIKAWLAVLPAVVAAGGRHYPGQHAGVYRRRRQRVRAGFRVVQTGYDRGSGGEPRPGVCRRLESPELISSLAPLAPHL